MSHSCSKKVIAVAVLAIAVCAFSGAARAEDNGVVAFFKKVFKYPVKTTENVANTTGHAVANTGGVVEAAARNTGEVATGHLEKTGDIVAEPAGKTANTAGALLSETAGSPVKAAEDVQKEE